jgi:hypothetical protein
LTFFQGTIRGEIRERKDRIEKLKIRHDLAIQVDSGSDAMILNLAKKLALLLKL